MKKINSKKIPNHIAIIMDGNGRWAKSKMLPRAVGHKNGVKAVRETVEMAAEIGIEYVTLYAFSTENWDRPKKEVRIRLPEALEGIPSPLAPRGTIDSRGRGPGADRATWSVLVIQSGSGSVLGICMSKARRVSHA